MAAPKPADDTPAQVLEFTLDDERYCVGLDAIDEIVKRSGVTALPDAPRQVVGVMNLRGSTTTIIDPKLVFDVTDRDRGDQVIIFEQDGNQQLGWLVDHVHEVTDLVDPDRDPVAENQYVNGIVRSDDQFVLWVDPGAVNGSIEET